MHWIGYMYRYWAYTYEQSSKHLFKYIKPEKLRALYFPYHSLDPAQAIDRILESKSTDEIVLNKIKFAREKLPKPLESDKKKFEMPI